MLEAIRSLYVYSDWANSRVLETAARLDEAPFLADEDGVGSVRDTLVHTAWAQWVWLERCRGGSPREVWQPSDFPDVASLHNRWCEVEGATATFVAALTESELDRTIRYVNFHGETWAYPLWQALLHQVNHATQHRSEVALMLTRFGHSPGPLDFLYYFDELGVRDARPG